MRRSSWLITISLVAALGCSDQPEVLVDSSGARFGWECERRGGCELTVLPETPEPLPCPDEYRPAYSYVWGRFIEIHSICVFSEGGSWVSSQWSARYLACSNDDDCPQLDFFESPSLYECRAGLCQNVDTQHYPPEWLNRQMAFLLCVAEVPRDGWASFDVEALLTEQCEDDPPHVCELPLPDPCWQPL